MVTYSEALGYILRRLKSCNVAKTWIEYLKIAEKWHKRKNVQGEYWLKIEEGIDKLLKRCNKDLDLFFGTPRFVLDVDERKYREGILEFKGKCTDHVTRAETIIVCGLGFETEDLMNAIRNATEKYLMYSGRTEELSRLDEILAKLEDTIEDYIIDLYSDVMNELRDDLEKVGDVFSGCIKVLDGILAYVFGRGVGKVLAKCVSWWNVRCKDLYFYTTTAPENILKCLLRMWKREKKEISAEELVKIVAFEKCIPLLRDLVGMVIVVRNIHEFWDYLPDLPRLNFRKYIECLFPL